MAKCAECGSVALLVTGCHIYPHRPDLYSKYFYLCECGAYVGCHSGTTKALGTPCGPSTRKARMKAHEAFDPLWKGGYLSRSAAYKKLARLLEIESAKCHIGMMSEEKAGLVPVAATKILEGF